MAAFLTGAQPRKTDGANIRAGVSADQMAAARIGDRTRLASLEIGTEASKLAGGCDSGYSCIYQSNISWRSATQPMPKEVNPKLIFERLFGSGSDLERQRRDSARKSVLDAVREDYRDLNGRLGAEDQRKLDEYFTAVREMELRIAKSGADGQKKLPVGALTPKGIPESYAEHLRLLANLMVLAFQTDTTRVATFVLANEGSNRSYPFIGVRDGHHSISHHGHDPAKLAKIQDINVFHSTHLAYLLERLKSVKEGDGNLLDHSMIVYGSGNGDGDRHNHDDLPILLAGKGCGTIRQGRHIVYQKETPLNNLWVSMLNRMDIRDVQLGDSTGELKKLS
ncbi:hypothetical protein EMGBS6_04530 [Opitutia bacterium]|nr:hypothetical protein EMGBS6_04530 [Opitutae bacterium]